MEVFYPSCNFARISPPAAKAMRRFMASALSSQAESAVANGAGTADGIANGAGAAGGAMGGTAGGIADGAGVASDTVPSGQTAAPAFSVEKPIAICCLREKRALGDGDTGLYLCQSCREHIQGGAPKSLWEWLLEQEDFEWPSYESLSVVIQDCWRDRDHPEVHEAVRAALDAMGVAWTEPEDARERSTFCGTRHVEPRTPRQRELMAGHPDFYVRKMPEEVQRELMAERVRELEACAPEGEPAVILTSCNACTQGLQLGGGNVVHLGELVMGTYEPAAAAIGEPAAAAATA